MACEAENYIFAEKIDFCYWNENQKAFLSLRMKRIGKSSMVSRRLLCIMKKIASCMQQRLFVKRKFKIFRRL